MTALSPQELLQKHNIDYVATKQGKFTTNCPQCSGGYLNVKLENDRVVWYCHNCDEGGSERYEQKQAQSDLGTPAAIYNYTDEQGALLFQALRFEPIGQPKQFRQRKDADQKKWSIKGVRIVPYHLAALIEAVSNDQPIYIVEGEKDVDTCRNHGLAATTNPMGAGKWRKDFNQFLVDADVIVCGDNDQPGRDHVQSVARSLYGTARCIRILDLVTIWPEIEEGEDISDWFKDGGTVAQLRELVGQITPWEPVSESNGFDEAPPWEDGPQQANGHAAPKLIPVTKPFPIDESKIPPRDWIIPGFLMRKQVTVIVAPSGAGKSLLTLQVGLACAANLEWSGWRPRKKFRVMVVNTEDDELEIKRRLVGATTVMENYWRGNGRSFDPAQLSDDYVIADTSNGMIVAQFNARTKTLIRTPALEDMVATIKALEIDLVFVDPFAETFEGDENSNSELKWAGFLWREVARRTNSAICLIHHTKKYASGMAGDVDAARGATALIGIARVVSTIFPMTKKEAEAMLEPNEQESFVHYMRYDDAKTNLSLKSPVAKWFYKETITLNNATDEQPPDQVGALVPWKPKGLMEGITEEMIIRFFEAVDRGIVDSKGNLTGEFYTLDTRKQSESEMSRYVGDLMMEFFKITNIETMTKILKLWIDAKPPRLVEAPKYKSPKTRKDRTRCMSELWVAAQSKNGNSANEQPADDYAPLV